MIPNAATSWFSRAAADHSVVMSGPPSLRGRGELDHIDTLVVVGNDLRRKHLDNRGVCTDIGH